MDPTEREAWAKRLMDDPKVNAPDTELTDAPVDVTVGFAEAMLAKFGKDRA